MSTQPGQLQPEVEPWDSRSESLGAYCRHSFFMKWGASSEDAWSDFTPTESIVTISAGPREWSEYITKDDWSALGDTLRAGYAPSIAGQALGRAHGHACSADLRLGLIEGVTALELALEERVRAMVGPNRVLQESVQAFWGLKLPPQLVAVARLLGTLSAEDIEAALMAIQHRNRVTHEGWEPDERIRGDLKALLRVTAAIIGTFRFKFPRPLTAMFSSEWAQPQSSPENR